MTTTPPNHVSNVPCLVCAFAASATTGGTIYAFGIYGDALKKSLEISQIELDALSATFFLAGLLTWAPGLLVDQKGTRFALIWGGLTGAAFVMMYWTLARRFWIWIPVHSVVIPLLVFLAVCICMSCALIIASIFKLTLLCGGIGTRGASVGVAKGFVGIGAGVYACIFQALRTEEESALDFLPVLAVFFVVCASLPAMLLMPHQRLKQLVIDSHTTPLHFRAMYVALLVLGSVIVWSSIRELTSQKPLYSNESRDWDKVWLLLILWFGPIASLLIMPRDTVEDDDEEGEEDAVSNGTAGVKTESTPLVTASHHHSIKNEHAPELKADYNLFQMLQTPSAWSLLWVSTILVGSGTYKTNNMGEMVEALGLEETVVPATLALFSVSQMAARVVTGVVSEATLPYVSRPFYLVVASLVGVASHVGLALVTDQGSFVVFCTLSGVAFGMSWPLMVLIVGEVFGVKHHGGNYMLYDGGTKALGTLLLGTYVAGTFYERHTTPENPLVCHGAACFRGTHWIVAALSVTGVVASLVLQYTSRHVYKMGHDKEERV